MRFHDSGIKRSLNVQYSTVHITVIAMTRNTIVIECYDLKAAHRESGADNFLSVYPDEYL